MSKQSGHRCDALTGTPVRYEQTVRKRVWRPALRYLEVYTSWNRSSLTLL